MKPESALGRLINLREQLTADAHDSPEDEFPMEYVWFRPGHYSAIIDDLDDIIRSIERGMKKEERILEKAIREALLEHECCVCKGRHADGQCEPPDSEDTERRERHKKRLQRYFTGRRKR